MPFKLGIQLQLNGNIPVLRIHHLRQAEFSFSASLKKKKKLCCTSETNIMYVNYISIKKKREIKKTSSFIQKHLCIWKSQVNHTNSCESEHLREARARGPWVDWRGGQTAGFGEAFSFFLFYKFIYLFVLFLAVLGLRCCARAFSSCSERRLLFVVVRRLLIAVASLVGSTGSRRGLQ